MSNVKTGYIMPKNFKEMLDRSTLLFENADEKRLYLIDYENATLRRWAHDPGALMLYLYLLKATESREVEYEGISVYPGQVKTSYRRLSRRTGLSLWKVGKCIRKLQDAGYIAVSSSPRFSIITVTDYRTRGLGIFAFKVTPTFGVASA